MPTAFLPAAPPEAEDDFTLGPPSALPASALAPPPPRLAACTSAPLTFLAPLEPLPADTTLLPVVFAAVATEATAGGEGATGAQLEAGLLRDGEASPGSPDDDDLAAPVR